MATLAGDWDEALALAGQFREGWERAGRPRAGNLTRGAYAAATVHGLRGDDDGQAAWLDIVDALATPGRPLSAMHFNEFFDALLLLHQGRAAAAMRACSTTRPSSSAAGPAACGCRGTRRCGPRRPSSPGSRTPRPDPPRAAGHAGQPGRRGHRGPGRGAGRATGPGLAPAAAALSAAGCRYQWARTLVAIGGAERARGEAELAAMGATVMAWPPG